MTVTIYHNPRCSKSRKTLEMLKDRGLSPIVIEYLNTPPDRATLQSILDKLNLEPRQLMRSKETVFDELNLSRVGLSAEVLIDAMVENPILIERPIVVSGDKAAIGRPPENINALFSSADD
ncbi:MAG: arsenate reductase [Gammaproteobacteria bacterium]|jgi:arsenate reductase